jgi:trehalose synthase (EC:5.4.99.16)
MRDDGYDIADYRNIHPEYGTMADFKLFVKEAHRAASKLSLNWSSITPPTSILGFRLRAGPAGSSKRDFYVWSDSNQKFPETRIIFQDAERSNWTWDEEAHAYYWHRFFHHQPDLNFNNPKVVKAVIKLMRFWLDLGVDGMRLDAIPYLCVREGTKRKSAGNAYRHQTNARGA